MRKMPYLGIWFNTCEKWHSTQVRMHSVSILRHVSQKVRMHSVSILRHVSQKGYRRLCLESYWAKVFTWSNFKCMKAAECWSFDSTPWMHYFHTSVQTNRVAASSSSTLQIPLRIFKASAWALKTQNGKNFVFKN
jgi:hypothetical protein